MGWIPTALGAYVLFVLLLFVMQRSLLYHPPGDRPEVGHYGVPGMHAVTVRTEDGLDLEHWYRPPEAPDGPVVVVFHGNAGHIGYRVSKFAPLLSAGFGLLLVEYRGFGGNPGRPTEAGLIEDSQSAMRWLAEQGVGPGRVFLYGESLGSAVATKLAAAQAGGELGHNSPPEPIAGLILEAPFTSVAAVAQSHYWYVPARWLVLDKWDSAAVIQEVDTPLLVMHGERDRTVPFKFGKALFDRAREPKELIALPGGGHEGALDRADIQRRVIDFVRQNAAAPAAADPAQD